MQAVMDTAARPAETGMRTFHAVLGNALAASVTNTFVWFAVTFWVYLQTNSVIAMLSTAIGETPFGTPVRISRIGWGSNRTRNANVASHPNTVASSLLATAGQAIGH